MTESTKIYHTRCSLGESWGSLALGPGAALSNVDIKADTSTLEVIGVADRIIKEK